MKKKNYLYLLLIVTLILIVSISLFVGNKKKMEESFSSLCISTSEYEEIKNTHTLSNSSLINNLYFDENLLFYDKDDNHFYYSLVKNSDTAYNPLVKWDDENYSVKVKDTKINDELIHQNKEIEIIIYNNNYYSESKLSCTTLPLMNVKVNVALEDIENSYQDARMILFDNYNNIFTDLKGSIKTRGSHVLEFPKKSFKLKLKDGEENFSISLLDLKESDKYILYPGYNDQERIRNVFSTNLWYVSCGKDNSFNIDNGQYYKYYEMFINDKYWGLYAIATPINPEILGLNSNENLYKKVNFAINEHDIDWEDIPIKGYDLKTNEDNPEVWKQLEHYYDVLFNSKNKEDIYEIIDTNNVIDIFLFYNLIQGIDNVSVWGDPNCLLNNTYMFTKNTANGYKMLFTPWDMDRTWGNGKDDEPYSIDVDYNSVMYVNPLFYLIELNDQKIMDSVNNRYLYLRQHEWSNTNIINMLKEYQNDIYNSGAYSRDIIKWPDSSKNNNELNIFIDYVQNRLSCFDKYMEEFQINNK